MSDVASGTIPDTKPKSQRWTRAAGALTAVFTFVGLVIMLWVLAQLPNEFSGVRTETWVWAAPAVVLAGLTYVGSAISLRGAVIPPLPLARTTELQLAEAFTSVATPDGVGSVALNNRFLGHFGVKPATAVGAFTLSSLASGIVGVTAAAIAGALSASQFSLTSASHQTNWWLILAAVLVVALIVGVVVWIGRIHRRVVPPVARAFHDLVAVLRRPRRAASLFGGEIFYTAVEAGTLVAVLHMLDVRAPIAVAVVLVVTASGVGSAVPIPGAMGAPEALVVAGLAAAGVDRVNAVAAAASYRLLTYWLPTIPGALAARNLKRHGLL
ncbi:MAG TPA: lysylphosphatidylglycerol synthase domain-containing protein [Acidimicrobiales bacterium]|nr:lysylphosphatidylglycerol synthase domain-containing protein [Acidimicrobiales bacterium]